MSVSGSDFDANHRPIAIINQNIDRYFAVSTHQEKKDITDEIVKEIQSTGRFLRYEPERKKWIRINHETARTKVAQAIQYRQRRRAKGYDISSIEGLVGNEGASNSESRKRRGSFTESGRQASILPPDQSLLGVSQGLLASRGDEFLSNNLQNRWAPLSRSDPCMGMANIPQQAIPRNCGRLSYQQSLDLALSQIQRRQQDNQQQDRYLANRRLESMRLLPHGEHQSSSQDEPDDARSATAIGECLEPIQFEALQAPTGAASLPSAPFASSSPADTVWRVQLLQAIQQQQQNNNAVFARPHQAGNTLVCPTDPISVHPHCYGAESSIGRPAPTSSPAASLRPPPQPEPESQAEDSSSFLDPLPFEIGTVAPMPEESKSSNWNNNKSVGTQQAAGDQDRKLSPREYPLL